MKSNSRFDSLLGWVFINYFEGLEERGTSNTHLLFLHHERERERKVEVKYYITRSEREWNWDRKVKRV